MGPRSGISIGLIPRPFARRPPSDRPVLNFNPCFSQQPLVRSSSNLKLKHIGLNQRIQRCQMKITSNGRWPKMEDDLKIWKVEYLSDHWSDLTQIWNLSLQDLTRGYKGVNWRWTRMEDDLRWKTTSSRRRPQKVEYLSNHLLDLPQIWNLSSGDQTKIKKPERKTTTKEGWKKTSKY